MVEKGQTIKKKERRERERRERKRKGERIQRSAANILSFVVEVKVTVIELIFLDLLLS